MNGLNVLEIITETLRIKITTKKITSNTSKTLFIFPFFSLMIKFLKNGPIPKKAMIRITKLFFK